MRFILSLFLLLFTAESCFCQSESDSNDVLYFQSYARKLCVNKNGQLVITTRSGEVAMSDNINSTWKMNYPVKPENYSSGPTLDQANFFNNDTGFVSGFVQDKNDNYDIIYHTTDHGRSWKAINFGKGGWVDDAVNLENGEAWMSVAPGVIAYTNDFGFNWESFKNPEPKQRFTSIYFNEKRQGIIGSLWDMLAYTNDNCKTWTLIPTPLDQKKYIKTNIAQRPEFSRVAIFGDFSTDPENSSLFFITLKGEIIRADRLLQPVEKYSLDARYYDLKCKKGSLYLMTSEKIIQIRQEGSPVISAFNAGSNSKHRVEEIGYFGNKLMGIYGNKIFEDTAFTGNWLYKCTLPFKPMTKNISEFKEDRLLYILSDDSLYYYDLKSKRLEITNLSSLINNFCKYEIVSIVFEKGSQGCFHNYADDLVYKRNENNEFEISNEGSKKSNHRDLLFGYDETISKNTIDNFSRIIPSLFNKQIVIGDLEFNDNDYKRCKSDILSFKKAIERNEKDGKTPFWMNQNNLDFTRLINLVDSVKYLDSATLNKILNIPAGNWSTTTNWAKIKFVNSAGNTLEVQNQFYDPSFNSYVWKIKLNGYEKSINTIEINRFIKNTYPSFIDSYQHRDLMNKIVKAIY